MLYQLTLNVSHETVVPSVLISALFVALLIAKEKNNERKRA